MSAVYFAKRGKFVKIGFASNPNTRMKTLLHKSRLACPADLDFTLPIELIRVVPGCRMRDERNMQLLFASHWVEGEWFAWSHAFREQMDSIEFVTHRERLVDLGRARKAAGVIPGKPVKEENWGMNAQQILAAFRDSRPATRELRAA